MKTITIKDIVKLYGVGISTVSREIIIIRMAK